MNEVVSRVAFTALPLESLKTPLRDLASLQYCSSGWPTQILQPSKSLTTEGRHSGVMRFGMLSRSLQDDDSRQQLRAYTLQEPSVCTTRQSSTTTGWLPSKGRFLSLQSRTHSSLSDDWSIHPTGREILRRESKSIEGAYVSEENNVN